MNDWQAPDVLDEYLLKRRLGAGGMGQVYLAFDTTLERQVAIKFLLDELVAPDLQERFIIEARAAARIQHRNVAAVYRVGSHEGRPYSVSELIEGQPLDEVPSPMPSGRVLEIVLGIARGLTAAHQQGVLHRDLKPANVILAKDGAPKLVDFGLAKMLSPASGGPGPELLEIPALQDPPSEDLPLVRAGTPIDPGATLDPAATLDPDQYTLAALRARQVTMAPGPAGLPPGSAWPPSDAWLDPPDEPARNETLAPDAFVGAGALPDDWDCPGGGAATLPPSSAIDFLPLDGPIPFEPEPEPDLSRGLTQAGVVMGSPDYLAPEAWRGQPATPSFDVYAFGALTFELLAGHTPFSDVSMKDLPQVVQLRAAPSCAVAAPGTDPRLAAIVDRCLQAEPAERFSSAQAVLDALEAIVTAAARGPMPDGNPYPGLRPFDVGHRALFFGREADVQGIAERLESSPFVLVSGDSGIGKSSVCRAGVVPRLSTAGLEGRRRWTMVTLTPGRYPLRALAASLAGPLRSDEAEVAEKITQDPDAVLSDLRRSLGPDAGFVAFVDQLEELITQGDPEEARVVEAFLGRWATGWSGLKLIGTCRADFLTRLAGLPNLGPEVARALYLLGPLNPQRLRRVIMGPAEATGVRFESDALVDSLVEEAAVAQGSLPLLQFALARLWEARDKASSTISAAAVARVGGVTGALTQHAERVLEGLGAAQQNVARQILIRLVTSDGTKAIQRESELVGEDPNRVAVLAALVQGRLLIARDSEDGAIYELAHDALITGWATLRGWLSEDAGEQVVRERLGHAAAEWVRLGHAKDALWSGRQLEEARRLDRGNLTAGELGFLSAARRTAIRRRALRMAAVVAVPLGLGLAYGGARLNENRRLEARLNDHLRRASSVMSRAGATDQRAIALRERMQEELTSQRRVEAEKTWVELQAKEASAVQSYAAGARILEAAVALAPGRVDVRRLFAGVLDAQVSLAHRRRRHERRDELLARLALYDEDRTMLDRWSRPTSLAWRGLPVGTVIEVERYRRNAGRRVPVRLTDVPADRAARFAPGSYRFTIRAPDRPPVRVPVVLEPGRDSVLTPHIPIATAVPEGFVYVAGGSFLFGSSADDESRLGFFDAPPLHSRAVRGFFVQRHEVTFEDWIGYLESLDPKSRARRAPGAMSDGSITGAFRLSRGPDAVWSLRYRQGDQAYSAREGELIEYPERDRRRTQDWLRLPIIGISADDGEAYAAWLRSTGRVPRARLCSEAEWERASRGADDREFPHGDRLEVDDANFDQTYAKAPGGMGPDEVGSHPASASPFDAQDMVGNALEWTTSSLNPGRYVLRGGSFFYDIKTNRIPNRSEAVRSLRLASVGLRLCADLPEPLARVDADPRQEHGIPHRYP